jgi:hypothetical protein
MKIRPVVAQLFMKIRMVGAELFHADGQTDMTKLMLAFRTFFAKSAYTEMEPEEITCSNTKRTGSKHFEWSRNGPPQTAGASWPLLKCDIVNNLRAQHHLRKQPFYVIHL